MKVMINLLLVGILVVFCCFIGKTQIVYSNAFNLGTGNIQGMAPNVANDYAGGYSSATWNDALGANDNGMMTANGVNSSTLGNSWTLPFTPQAGYVYHLTATLTFTGNPGTWVGIGFAQNNSYGVPVGYGRFADSGNGGPVGYDWMILTESSGKVQYFTGPKGNTPQLYNGVGFTAGTGTHTVDIVLDTSHIQWSITASVDGTQLATSASANLIIGAVGITQNGVGNPSAYQWSNLMLTATVMPITNNTYWVGPTALGTGDGSSSTNAASYLDGGFWSGVQSLLQATNVTVNFVNGTYNAGTLNLNDMGNPVHRLTLQAENPDGPVFDPAGNMIIGILGSQNIKFDGLVFTGSAAYWGVNCQPDVLKACRNLQFSHCQFVNLTNVVYGAIGLLNGTRDVLVDNCTFSTLTDNNGNHQHMIYASHDIVGVVVTNCYLQDCLADYVRFRDDSEYCTVQNCQFVSTMRASAWPFISVELYNITNSDSAGDEFFGNYFQISSNSFAYDVSGGPGPYSAFHFSDAGYSPYSYHCDLTSSEAAQLASGTSSFQQSFLQTNMGIIASSIKMFGNTYSGVQHAVDYTYNNSPTGGWTGTIDISGVPDSSGAPRVLTPILRNGNFDLQGLQLTSISVGLKNYECLFRDWLCSPKYTGILRVPGFDGTTNALRFNQTQNQIVYQWITSPGPMWTMDCEFAIGSGFTGTGTKFQVDLFHNDITGSKVSVGVNSSGQFGIYSGGAFVPLAELGTVSFSTNNIYRLRIVGNYAASTPYVNIYTSDANSHVLSHQSLGLMDWVNGDPVSGQSFPETIAFYNYTAPVVLDQIAFTSGLAGQSPIITNTLLNNGQFVFSGTNGFPGDKYYLFSSTNLVSGLWTVEATNAFDANGAFSITNAVAPGAPQEFYRLELQ